MSSAGVLTHFGRVALFAWALGRSLRRPRAWVPAFLAEARRQASDALPLGVLLSTLGGALIAQQTGYQFQGNLPNWVIGSIVSSSLVTEVTPLFVGLALVGMVGTRIAAELGAMRVTEQVDALEIIGRDPVLYLALPRVLAGGVIGPMVMAVALTVSMLCGWIATILVTNANTQDFWFGVRHYMRDFPMFFALIKGFAFGTAITFVGSYVGLQAGGGSIGVGRNVKIAVVGMLLSMILLDVLLVPLLKIVRL